MEYYTHHLNQLKQYPDLYLKLIDYPNGTLKGILNELLSSKINLNDEEKVRAFFEARLPLEVYM